MLISFSGYPRGERPRDFWDFCPQTGVSSSSRYKIMSQVNRNMKELKEDTENGQVVCDHM